MSNLEIYYYDFEHEKDQTQGIEVFNPVHSSIKIQLERVPENHYLWRRKNCPRELFAEVVNFNRLTIIVEHSLKGDEIKTQISFTYHFTRPIDNVTHISLFSVYSENEISLFENE